MFHYINKAWVEILARQLKSNSIKNALCVYTNVSELRIIQQINKKYNVTILSVPKRDVNTYMEYFTQFEFGIFDDILVSHDLYDTIILDFLAKHCRRIHRDL